MTKAGNSESSRDDRFAVLGSTRPWVSIPIMSAEISLARKVHRSSNLEKPVQILLTPVPTSLGLKSELFCFARRQKCDDMLNLVCMMCVTNRVLPRTLSRGTPKVAVLALEQTPPKNCLVRWNDIQYRERLLTRIDLTLDAKYARKTWQKALDTSR